MEPVPPHHERPRPKTMKYHVQTSDVLQDMRVNVSLEGQSEVIWHKQRFLEDKEIIEQIIHNATNALCWTIHRPLRGWYIRLRAPSFPPGVFISLSPVPTNAPYHVDASLTLSSRTNIPISLPIGGSHDRGSSLQPRDSVDSSTGRGSIHSYPPTPVTSTPSSSPPKYNIPLESGASRASAASTQSTSSSTPIEMAASSSSDPKDTVGNMPSASSSTSTLVTPTPAMTASSSTTKLRPRPISHLPSFQITQFVLAPSSVPPAQTQADAASTSNSGLSFFTKALSVLKNHRPSHSNSFTLCRVLDVHTGTSTQGATSSSAASQPGPASPPPPYTSTATLTSELPPRKVLHQPPSIPTNAVLHTPLLTFHDRTSLLTVRSLSGLLEIDEEEERQLGVDTSFWVAVALTYLEFLEERESYLAALSD